MLCQDDLDQHIAGDLKFKTGWVQNIFIVLLRFCDEFSENFMMDFSLYTGNKLSLLTLIICDELNGRYWKIIWRSKITEYI